MRRVCGWGKNDENGKGESHCMTDQTPVLLSKERVTKAAMLKNYQRLNKNKSVVPRSATIET